MPPTPLLQLVTSLRQRLADGEQALRSAYEAHPRTTRLLKQRSVLVDEVLRELWRAIDLPRDHALVAVGGYGRGELFPASDVDLLLLLPEAADEQTSAKLSELIGALWDLRLQVGHSVRTVEECLEASAQDITVQTSLLEARLVCGHAGLFESLRTRYLTQLDSRKFFKDKQLEQQQRYARYHDTPYALEPDCKESPGGLRDLQMLGWIARASGLGQSWRDLSRNRLITGEEAGDLRSIERFLQHIRIRLHYLTGRAEDHLLFDHQENLARSMGIEAMPGKRASEVLMQRYYLTAKKLTQINTILLQNYSNVIFREQGWASFVINERFQSQRNLLDIRHDKIFEEQPSALLECFLLLQQRSELKGMTARTLRGLWLNRNRINASFRADPVNKALFLQILQQKRGIVHEFRRMNQYGILSRYIPPWRRIVCQMQHDLFHVYTVDQHILMVLRNLRRFTMGEHAHEYPLMTRLMLSFDQPWLLYLAALFHDIAKGRGGDHSQLGKDEAYQFCEQHGLSAEQRDLVVWLVAQHLTMSSVAQKQDTSDPEVIRRFADIVRDERRLAALYLLSHADIRGTSPKVWNGWRSKLLEDLYYATSRMLRGATPEQALGLADRQQDARRLLRYHGLAAGLETPLWEQLDTVYFMRYSADEIAWHTRMLYHCVESHEPVIRARVIDEYDGLQVMVYTRDARDLFVRLAGFFGKRGFSIQDAKIHTSRHGYALDSFVLQDPGQSANYRDVVQLIEHELTSYLIHNTPTERPATGRLSRQVRHFPVQPEVSVRPDEAGRYHLLSLTASDRPGLLFAVAEVLARNDVQIITAKIATLGERVEDSFLLKGAGLASDHQVMKIERELLECLQL